MELFKNPKFDFLGNKWPFIIGSLVLIAAGMTNLVLKGGPRYGIDFKGGTLMYVKFAKLPPLDISTELKSEQELAAAREMMVKTLTERFGDPSGKLDFNNAGAQLIADHLRGPLQRKGIGLSDDELNRLADAMREFRDTPPRSGLLTSFDQLSAVPGVTPSPSAASRSLVPRSGCSFATRR